MANDKSVNKKRSISARVDIAVYEKMLEVAKDPNLFKTLNLVTDSLPSLLTSTFRSPDNKIFFFKGALIVFLFKGQ